VVPPSSTGSILAAKLFTQHITLIENSWFFYKFPGTDFLLVSCQVTYKLG